MFLGLDLALIAVNVWMELGLPIPSELIRRQADLTLEANLATWCSSVQLLITGLVALLAARHEDRRVWGQPLPRVAWLVFGVGLVVLSADEVSQTHEYVGGTISAESVVVQHLTEGGFGYGWLVAALPVIAAAVVFIAWFVMRLLEDRRARLLGVLGLLAWVVVLVAESIEGLLVRAGKSRGLQLAIEEGAELLGTTAFLAAFAIKLRRMTARKT